MPRLVLDLLQRPPKTLDILLYLLNKEETKVSELRKEMDLSPSTCHAAVQSLLGLDLIFKREGVERRLHTYVGLTIKGREVAEHLRPMSETVESTLSALRLDLRTLEMRERTEAENRRMLEVLLALMDAEFRLGGWDDMESHARRAFDIASALNDSGNVASALLSLGEMHFGKGAMEEAQKEFAESLSILKRIGDLNGASRSHYFIGAIKEKRGQLQDALKEYKEADRLAMASEDNILRARAGLGIGRVLAKKGEYRESLKRFKESVDAFERMGELDELPRAYTCAGSSAFYTDVDGAIMWHQKCIDLSRRTGDLRMLVQGLSNLAGCYNKKKESKQALRHLKEAAGILKVLDEKDMLAGLNIQLGWTYSLDGRWSEAEHHFFQAIDMARKHDFAYELGDALLNSGLVNIDRGKTQDAKHQLKEALEIFERLSNQQKINKVVEALGKISR